MPSLRANGAPQFDAPCEDGSRASLEAKKRAAAPETVNPVADMVLDSAAKERRQRCKQAWPVALPRPRERQPATAGEAARSFGKQAAALGNAAPAPKPPKAFANDAGIIKATDRDPHLLAWASEAGRVAKRMRTGSAWEQSMSIMRRLGEFATAHGRKCRRGTGPFYCEFEAGEKQRRAAHNGAVIADGVGDGAASDVSFGPSQRRGGKSHKADAASDAAGTGPRLQRDVVREGPRSNAARVGHGGSLERNCAAAEERIYRAPERPQRPHC
ncbi:hypothetical protein ERJ75_000384100 [Trypanosoma vivax]|nr:hypothetical protein ERJ75_000384100 [Trypanosoma vivax]